MFYPKTQYAKIAFDTILFYLTTGQIRKPDDTKITPDLKLKLGCIIYIYDSKDKLISFYGDVYPQNPILYDEIVENALKAIKNNKNTTLSKDDLENIKAYVDVLSVPQKVNDLNEIKPQKQGLFIMDKSGKQGFVLPNTKGVRTGQDQFELAKKQAGIKQTNDSEVEIVSFKVTRYN